MELNNSIKEICSYQNSSESQEPLFSSQTDLSHQDQDYHQLKLLTLQLWQDQQQKLGNPLPSNADFYQIMRHDHPLGIDAFVSQACQLSPHLNPIQALLLLQECIKIMPNGYSKPFKTTYKNFQIVHRSDGYDYSLGEAFISA
ncbi:hypothetical protein CMK18_19270 [Candidatus Poribacteria bacterium]|nr:hypothetical protein [Candidatus Poribacteria bacterium]